MKVKELLVVFLSTLLTLIWISAVMCQEIKSDKLESLYRAFIDERILKCESKATMINSKSNNIRKEAELALLKARYYRSNKENLIQLMIENGIGTKSHQVQYYLIKNFFSFYRSNNSKITEVH